MLGTAATWAQGRDALPKRFIQIDSNLYRGAQPSAEGFRALAEQGIKTVIDLRAERDEIRDEQRLVEAAGMKFVSIPVGGSSTPADAQVAQFFSVIDDPASGPVFFHCKRGADRTGTMAAIYRIRRQGWDVDRAISEAKNVGMHWYFVNMRSYIRSYAERNQSRAAQVAAPKGYAPAF